MFLNVLSQGDMGMPTTKSAKINRGLSAFLNGQCAVMKPFKFSHNFTASEIIYET